jgi:sugar O-acyltransferase (sialic acid O-acetyltransferase NeuD family)
MNEKLLLIVGGKSTALEIFEVASAYYCDRYSKIYFLIGDSERKSGDNQIFDSELKDYAKNYLYEYIYSITSQKIRLKIQKMMEELFILPTNIIHPSAIISNSSRIGLGNYIAANCILSVHSSIGNHNLINFNSVIGHDSQLRDHVILNPGARVSGNVKIGSRVLIGSNSFIFQGKNIGNDTIIDALTYIDRDIESNHICTSKNTKILKRVI